MTNFERINHFLGPDCTGHGSPCRWCNHIAKYVILFALDGERFRQRYDTSFGCRVLGVTWSVSWNWETDGSYVGLSKITIYKEAQQLISDDQVKIALTNAHLRGSINYSTKFLLHKNRPDGFCALVKIWFSQTLELRLIILYLVSAAKDKFQHRIATVSYQNLTVDEQQGRCPTPVLS